MKFFLQPLRLALLVLCALAAAPGASAQVNINLTPPSWGPAVAAGQQYYYIPETNGFYDVPARQYVVRRDGRWVRTANLSGFNTANFHPVIVDYVGAQPWTRYEEYRTRYPGRNPGHGGLPPGQAKKLYRREHQNGQYDDHRHHDRRRYEQEDLHHDRGNYKNKGKGKKDKD